MNYRHIYHAGNFADVFKHLVIVEVIQYYTKKESPFFVLDAFAGIGEYDITDIRVEKTSEIQDGIFKLLDAKSKVSKEFDVYIELVERYLSKNIYPGSPVIIRDCLRMQDRFICAELHPEDYLSLKKIIPSAHKINAYSAIKAFLPPEEKRGIVLLDAPFEERDEFSKLLSAIQEIHQRFRNGTIIVWYPIKDKKEVADFYNQISSHHSGEYVISELALPSSEKLHKTGILVINPTWKLNEFLENILKDLTKKVFGGSFIVQS